MFYLTNIFMVFVLFFSIQLAAIGQRINIPEPVPPPAAVRATFDLDPFYEQWIDVGGFPVVASAKTSPYALKEAAWLIQQMIGHRQDILQALAKNGVRFAVMAYTELTTQIPEHSDLEPPDFWDRRTRGLGATPERPAVSCGEENLLNYAGDPFTTENILIHEFAHAIHLMGLNTVDPGFDSRLRTAFEAAVRKGLWKGTYAITNKEEYWAEGVQSWFDANLENDGAHNHVNTRDELKVYDPVLASLLTELFDDLHWRYTPATTRLHLPHLQGLDVQNAPTFLWIRDLDECSQQSPSSNNYSIELVNLKAYNVGMRPCLGSANSFDETVITIENRTGAEFTYSWLDFYGNESDWSDRVFPNGSVDLPTYVGSVWLLKDRRKTTISVFEGQQGNGRVVIDIPSGPPAELVKVSGDTQSGTPGTRLAEPFVVKVTDKADKPVKGVQVRFRVTAGGGKLSATRVPADANGQVQTFLTLGKTLGVNKVQASVLGINTPVTFSTSIEPKVLIAEGQRPPMYWVDSGAGTLHRLVGTRVENLLPEVKNATSLTVDVVGGKFYWTEKTSDRTGRIRCTNLDGSNVQLVRNLTSVPLYITVDMTGRKLYLINSWKKIQRLDVDGSNFQPNLITGLETPKHIALNVSDNKIYWTEQTGDGTGRIQRANLNGSNIELVKELTSVPTGLTIDTLNGKLYLTSSSGKVQRLNVDGSNFQPNFITDLNSPEDIAVDMAGGKLYWIEQGSIRCANLNGENIQNVITGLGSPANLLAEVGTSERVVPRMSKVTGPWLWIIAPTERGQGSVKDIDIDSLAVTSDGAVTEAKVAAEGAKAGDVVGYYTWTLGEIAPTGENNINDTLNKIGLVKGQNPANIWDDINITRHSSYALITLVSDKARPRVRMGVGGDDSIKVWLNGKVVHRNAVNRRAVDFLDYFNVRLQKGNNLVLVKVSQRGKDWSMFVGIDADVKTKLPSGIPAAPLLSASETSFPTETVLLSNYPNPLNPETWIPYQLVKPADVRLHIYSVNGSLVRTLALGHQPAGVYHGKSRAAYWDGRNEQGERVASGVYFYTLSAGEFTATRKMLIRK